MKNLHAFVRNDEMRGHLAGRIGSRDWWTFIFPSTSIAAADCLLDLERRFYSGAANIDFEMGFLPFQKAVIAVARKCWLPASELSRTLLQFLPGMPETVRIAVAAGQSNILVLGDAGPSSQALQMAFLEFMQPGTALQIALRN